VKSLSSLFLTASMIVALYAPSASAQGKKGASSSGTPSASNPTTQAASQGSSSTAAFESQMLAYGGLDHIAKALAKKVCSQKFVNKDNSTVVIYDQTAFATLQSYQAFVANLRVLAAAYQTLIPSATLLTELKGIFTERSTEYSTLAQNEKGDKKKLDQHFSDRWKLMSLGLSSTVDPFSDAASLLSAVAIASNTESPGQIIIPDSAMAVALTREIKGACNSTGLTIVYPPLFGKGSSSDFASADIQVEIQKLDDIRAKAVKSVDDANAAFITKYSPQKTAGTQTTTGVAPGQTTATTSTVTGSAATTGDTVLTGALTDINGLYDSFMNSLLQINSSTGVMGSASVIQGYQLANLLKGVQKAEEAPAPPQAPAPAPEDDPYATWWKSPAFVLLANVANAGGTEHVHKNIWTALWSGDEITYSGGAIVNVSLWRADSASTSPIYVDALRYRAPFSEIKEPAGNADDVDLGDNLAEPSDVKKKH